MGRACGLGGVGRDMEDTLCEDGDGRRTERPRLSPLRGARAAGRRRHCETYRTGHPRGHPRPGVCSRSTPAGEGRLIVNELPDRLRATSYERAAPSQLARDATHRRAFVSETFSGSFRAESVPLPLHKHPGSTCRNPWRENTFPAA
eukprot:1484352-Prymnesium_polylepis.1